MYLTACVICVLFPKHCQPNYHVIQSQQSRFLNYIYKCISKQNAIKNNTAISKQWNSKLQNYNLIKRKDFQPITSWIRPADFSTLFIRTSLFLSKLSNHFSKNWLLKTFSYFKPILSYKKLICYYIISSKEDITNFNQSEVIIQWPKDNFIDN